MPDISLVESLTAQLMDVNRELEAANSGLRASEAARTEMLANIFHDLRAPLTAVRSALDFISRAENPDSADVRAAIAVIDRRVAVLENLVGELYYSVSIEQPGFSLRLEALHVSAFLEEWFYGWEMDERCAGRVLSLGIPRDFDAEAGIDPDRMVRVLDNLMENAIRFSAEGDTLELGCRIPEETDCVVEIFLRDTGTGIRKEDLPHIFERTYTVSDARTPGENSGSGLGLHIARVIVEKHGGTIRCESLFGSGSMFIIRLPAIGCGGK